MKRTIELQQGFTLIELLIAFAVVAILAAVAVPAYLNYTKRAYFSEVANATSPFKKGVTDCYQALGTLTGCNAGSNHIPNAIVSATGAVASIAVADGVITATPVAQNGIVTRDTYILIPTVTNGQLTWAASGGAVTDGLVNS